MDLLAQVCDGAGHRRSAHQLQCAHCSRVLEEYQRLWAPFDALAADPVRAPRGIIERALAYVRELTTDGDGPLLPLDDPLAVSGGSTTGAGADLPVTAGPGEVRGQSWATTRVVVSSARLAAQGVRGVRLALTHLDDIPTLVPVAPHPAADAASGGQPEGEDRSLAVSAPMTVSVTVAADYGQDLHALADRIRARVVEGVQAYLGTLPVAVSVHIDDVFPARP